VQKLAKPPISAIDDVMFCMRQLEDKILDRLEVSVTTKYSGPVALNPESLLLNVIMLQVCASVNTWFHVKIKLF